MASSESKDLLDNERLALTETESESSWGSFVSSLVQPRYVTELRRKMCAMREAGKFTDVVLLCGGSRAFAVHRVVLASCSPFFADLVRPDVPTTTVELQDVDGGVMERLLRMMYCGFVDPAEDGTNSEVMAMLTTAHLLQVQGAPEHLTLSWLSQKPGQRIRLFFDWADEFSNGAVRSTVLEHAVRHLDEVLSYSADPSSDPGDDIAQLTPEQMTDVLRHPLLATSQTPDTVDAAIAAWVQVDPVTRTALLDNLVEHRVDAEAVVANIRGRESPTLNWVKMIKEQNFISAEKLTKAAERRILETAGAPEYQLVSSSKIEELEVLREETEPEQEPAERMAPVKTARSCRLSTTESANRQVCNQSFRDAIFNNKGPALVISGRRRANWSVAQAYLASLGAWSQPIELKLPPMDKHSCVYCNGQMFYVGGEHEGLKLQSVMVFDINSCQVRHGQLMRVSRCSTSVAVVDKTLVVVGGLNRFNHSLSHVESYDILNDLWHLMPPVRHNRHDSAVAVLDKKLYVIGGWCNTCEMIALDREEMGWVPVAALPTMAKEVSLMGVSIANTIYSFPRFQPDRIYHLDPRENLWTEKKTGGPLPHGLLSVFQHRGDVYALDESNHLFVYDIKQSIWQLSIVCPKSCPQALHLIYINLDELNSH